MKFLRRQAGFAAVEVALVAVVVVLVGFLGYTFYTNSQKQAATSAQSDESAVASDLPAVAEVNSTTDLDNVARQLDDTDVDGSNTSDVSSLDGQSADF